MSRLKNAQAYSNGEGGIGPLTHTRFCRFQEFTEHHGELDDSELMRVAPLFYLLPIDELEALALKDMMAAASKLGDSITPQQGIACGQAMGRDVTAITSSLVEPIDEGKAEGEEEPRPLPRASIIESGLNCGFSYDDIRYRVPFPLLLQCIHARTERDARMAGASGPLLRWVETDEDDLKTLRGQMDAFRECEEGGDDLAWD